MYLLFLLFSRVSEWDCCLLCSLYSEAISAVMGVSTFRTFPRFVCLFLIISFSERCSNKLVWWFSEFAEQLFVSKWTKEYKIYVSESVNFCVKYFCFFYLHYRFCIWFETFSVLQAIAKRPCTALFIYNIPSLQTLFIQVSEFEYSTAHNIMVKF